MQSHLAVRRTRSGKGLEPQTNGKFLSASSPGLVYKYLLTNLVRCECGLSMTPNSSSVYINKAGEEKRYTGYICPGHIAGTCDNSRRVSEAWLRNVVLSVLRERLFPWSEE